MFKSLKTRINLVVALIMGVVFLAFGGVSVYLENQRLDSAIAEKQLVLPLVSSAAVETADLRGQLFANSAVPERMLKDLAKASGVSHITVFDKNDAIVGSSRSDRSQDSKSSETLRKVKESGKGIFVRVNAKDEEFLGYYAPIRFSEQTVVGTVEVAIPITTLLQARTRTLWLGLIMTLFLISLVVVSLSLLLGRAVITPIAQTAEMAGDLARGKGDLTKRLEVTSQDEIGRLAEELNLFINDLHALIKQLSGASHQVAVASEQLSAGSKELARGAAEQSKLSTEVAAAADEMSATTSTVAQNAREAAKAAGEALSTASRGDDLVAKTVVGMEKIARAVSQVGETITALGSRSREIGEIIRVIEEISDQTNLLALNAAIEAARAGEQGRGFAVVADEVRHLAEKTAKATKEIASMIQAIQRETSESVAAMEEGKHEVGLELRLAKEAGTVLGEIKEKTTTVASEIDQIAAAAEQQREATSEISERVERVALISQNTAAGVQQSAQATQNLSRLASEMLGLVGRFKV